MFEGYEALNVQRATHTTIGDQHFVVLEGFLGLFPGKQRPAEVPVVIMQYEISNVTLPLDRTTYRMMQMRDGDIVWVKFDKHDTRTDNVFYVITDAR